MIVNDYNEMYLQYLNLIF